MSSVTDKKWDDIYPTISSVSEVSCASTESSESDTENDNINNVYINPKNDEHLNVDDDDRHIQKALTSQISNISSLSDFRRNQIERSVSHFDSMEKRINRLPQFYRADEFLKCLSEFTIENESLKDFRKLIDQNNPNQKFIKYEVIIENQRGATLFGSKLYSKESVLYPLDPPKYQTLTGQNLSSITMYPEPANNWHWSWKQWHVMMINDVDEEGWIYSAVRFGGYHWTGVGKFGNFVRRRIWIRMSERSKIGDDEEDTEEGGDEADDENYSENEMIFVNPRFVNNNVVTTSVDNNEGKLMKQKELSMSNRPLNHTPNEDPNTKTLDLSNNVGNKRSMFSFKDHLKNSFHTKSSPPENIEEKPPNTIDQLPNDDSVVSFSKEDVENDAHLKSQFLNSLPHNKSRTNEFSDLETLEETYDLVKSKVVDRMKISVILNSFFSFKSEILHFLVNNYSSTEDKSESWIYKFSKEIKFHDSKRIFLSQFKERLDNNTKISTYESLSEILSICKEIEADDSYRSEEN